MRQLDLINQLNNDNEKVISWLLHDFYDNTKIKTNTKINNRVRSQSANFIEIKASPKMIHNNSNNNNDRHTKENKISGVNNDNIKYEYKEHKLGKLVINKTLNNEIKQYFIDNCDEWEFDIFTFEKICNKYNTNCFMASVQYIILPLSTKLGIKSEYIISYLHEINNGYKKDVIYHNSVHACDVMLTLNIFLNSVFFNHNINIDLLEMFTLLISALIHDYKHPGLNNSHLIKTQSKWALLYNDISVLENMHVSLSCQILKKNHNNFAKFLTNEQQNYFRKLLIQTVLATDMTKHNAQVSILQKHANILYVHLRVYIHNILYIYII